MEIKAFRQSGGQDQKRVEACRRLSNAARFRSQWKEDSLKHAVREYDAALLLWKAVGDRAQEAATLKSAGDVWETLAEWQTALSCYEEARKIYSRLNNLPRETGIINALSALFINQGEYQKALDIYAPEHGSIDDPWLKAQFLR